MSVCPRLVCSRLPPRRIAHPPTPNLSTEFVVIFPSGHRHVLPVGFYQHYLDHRLIRATKKRKNVAHLGQWLRAWPQENASLKFEVVTPRTITPYALDCVEKLWRRIMQMDRTYNPNAHERGWYVYSRQTGDGTTD